VAAEPYCVEGLREYFDALQRFGEDASWLDRDAVRAEVDSPTFHAGVWQRGGGVVDPARLAWGLRDAVLRLGVRVHEQTPVLDVAREGSGLVLRCPNGVVRARRVVFATNAFRSPLRPMRRAVIPVWDYALVSEPLSAERMASIGWRNRQGLGDTGNQFHYYRLTDDDRILWGGYEAGYHFGSRIDSDFEQDPPTFEMLSRQFFDTFPQLEGLRFTHSWGGPIGTTTRFCMDVGTAHGGRAAWAIGYTGLGVGASRFGARVALDLLDRPEADHLSLRLLRRRAVPWPPEPLRYIGVQLTRRAMAKADQNEGRRGPWLRLLDSLGLGFDS
jgi:glycine/D-amino acid oxidase-like deaminating enzyme